MTAFPVVVACSRFVVLDVQRALPMHQRKRFLNMSGRVVKNVVYHHTAGNSNTKPLQCVIDTAHCHITERNWPGIGYHIYVPYSPVRRDNRWEVYQCHDLSVRAAHVEGHNAETVGVVFQGSFDLGHGVPGTVGQPSVAQAELAIDLWDLWLRDEFLLRDEDLRGHFDYGKRACPGGYLEGIVRGFRSRAVSAL